MYIQVAIISFFKQKRCPLWFLIFVFISFKRLLKGPTFSYQKKSKKQDKTKQKKRSLH